MKYIVDSSVAVKWVLVEKDKDKADLLRNDFQNGIHDLIAVDFFPYEVAHALTRAERQLRINQGEALQLWTDVMLTAPTLHPGLALTPRAIDLSSQMRIGVYDCLFVALAEQENCQFVTADSKLVANVQKRFPFVVELSSLP